MGWWFAVQAGAAAVSLIQNERASKAALDAAKSQAALYDLQAERIMEAAGEQIRNVRIQGQKLEGRQTVAYAAAGVDVSSGSVMSVIGDTHRQINAEISSINREAQFQADMARMGAAGIRAVAEDKRKADKINMWVGAAGQMSSIYSDYSKYSQLAKQTKTLEKIEKKPSEVVIETRTVEQQMQDVENVTTGKIKLKKYDPTARENEVFNLNTGKVEKRRTPILGEIKRKKRPVKIPKRQVKPNKTYIPRSYFFRGPN